MTGSFQLSDSVPRTLWPLIPQSPTDMRALFSLLRDELQRSIVGYERTVAKLALIGTTHLAQDAAPSTPLSRVLIIGEPGTGRTTMALRLAELIGLPTVYVPVPSLAETNWRGTDIPALIGAMYKEVFRDHSPTETAELAQRAVVIVDDVDDVRLPGHYSGSSETFSYQAGRQRSLVPVVGDGVVPVEVGSRSISWPSRRALVIAVGHFGDLEAQRIAPGHLSDWGLIPELSRAICSGAVLRLPDLQPSQTVRLLRRKTAQLATSFGLFGYRLSVSDEALAYVVDHLLTERFGHGIPNTIAMLADAADRILLRLIDSAAPQGHHHTLAPDDLDLPEETPGTWRE